MISTKKCQKGATSKTAQCSYMYILNVFSTALVKSLRLTNIIFFIRSYSAL